MHNAKQFKTAKGYAVIVIIILIASILLGFLLDFVLTQIEYAIYRKPQEYQGFVTKYSTDYGVPENLVYAVIKTESGFNPAAVSEDMAVGLMQITEDTFADIRDRILKDGHMDAGMRYDPETNIRYGVRYLSYLHERFANWDTVVLAYFEGETRIAEWLQDHTLDPEGDGILNSIPQGFDGGESYLKKVNNAWQKYDKLYSKK